jgi:spore germination protein KC
MKTKLICLLLVSTMIMTGCFSYKDINRVLFVTALLIDVDKENNIILYTEAFVTTRISGERMGAEEKIIFKSKNKTILEAARDINLRASYRLNYTQNKAIIFTERAAKYGLDNFIDILFRDQQALLRQYLFIYPGEPEVILQTKLKEEQFIGVFLADLVLNQRVTSKGVQYRIDEYINNRLAGNKVNLINIIDRDESQIDERLCIKGLTVIKNDKMVGKLNIDESFLYNLLKGNIKFGELELTNPEHKDKFISLKVLKSKTKNKLNYDGSKITLKKNITIRTSFAEAQKSIYLTDDSERETIIKLAENKIKDECMKLFNHYKEKDIDLLNVQKDFNRKYPNANIKDVTNVLELDLNIKVIMEGSTDSTDFK